MCVCIRACGMGVCVHMCVCIVLIMHNYILTLMACIHSVFLGFLLLLYYSVFFIIIIL